MFVIISTKIIEFDFKNFFSTIKSSKALIIILVFLLYQFLTLVWTETSYADAHTFIRSYLVWFAIPVLAVSIQPKNIKFIITSFLLGMGLSEIIAYGMYFNLWTFNGHGSDYPSPFMHHTSYSVFMSFTAILLLNRLYSKDYNIKEKIVMGIFFTTISGNLFISQGRIGQLSFAFSILVATILHFKLTVKTLLASLGIIFFIFFSAYKMSPMFQERITLAKDNIERIQNGDLNSSWGIRVAYLILGTDIMKDNLLFGIGLEDTKTEALKYLSTRVYDFPPDVIAFMKISHHFHNQYFMTTLQSGLLGLGLLLFLLYSLLFLPIKNKELKHLSILFTTILIIVSISDPFLMFEKTRTLFVLFSSIFIAASLDHKRQHS